MEVTSVFRILRNLYLEQLFVERCSLGYPAFRFSELRRTEGLSKKRSNLRRLEPPSATTKSIALHISLQRTECFTDDDLSPRTLDCWKSSIGLGFAKRRGNFVATHQRHPRPSSSAFKVNFWRQTLNGITDCRSKTGFQKLHFLLQKIRLTWDTRIGRHA